VVKISEQALGLLARYAWPGNVRELENVIERAVALEVTEAILPDRLPEALRGGSLGPAPDVAIGPGFNLDEHLRELEGRLLMEALDKAQGDRTDAARILGVTPRSLRYLIQKHALPAVKN
jgi:two-component system response regulator PilR (NtrC family)